MPSWILFILISIAVLAAAKFVFTMSIVLVSPITQGAMFHPSAKIRIRTFLNRVPMKKGELLVDVGCGDGRVLREARKRYGVRALGFEINPLACLLAKLRTMWMDQIEIRMKNFWSADLHAADVVFCYLFPDVMKRLALKLNRELRPGTRVVSCNFPLPGWEHLEVLRPESSLYGDPIYIYRFPESCPAERIQDAGTVVYEKTPPAGIH
ncbi:MAG: class I SAM-dependent methyltransferase [Syntrophales bacterium]